MKNTTGPSYTAISKAIRKVKTIRQLDKVQMLVVNYQGKYTLVKRLRDQYNSKNYRVRFPKTK